MKVNVGDFDALWEAVNQTGSFDICYGSKCVTAPGWGSPFMLILAIAEILWWTLVVLLFWKHRKIRKRNKRIIKSLYP